MVKQEIKKIIESVLKKMGEIEPSFLVEVPVEKSHGDYTTNVALILGKKLGKNPLEVAKEITENIKANMFEKIEVAGPGFINFHLSNSFFIDDIRKIDKNFGRNNILKNKKIIIEYTDPNILKEFHIGHLMSNAIGESISRVVEFSGANVKRLCYQGDVGMHVAKAIFGKLKNQGKSWQESYVMGSKLYDEDPIAKEEIEDLNKKIYERGDVKVNKIYDEGKKWSLEKFDSIYEKLGTKFDYLFFESETAGFGKKIVEDNFKNGIFEKGDRGAVIFEGAEYNLHTRVFINSEGLPTYEAKELGLAKIKHDKYKYDSSIIITANEQSEYFKVVLAAMHEVFPDLARKTRHIGHGVMRLPEGKMSSRAGHVVTAELMIEKAKEMILEKIKDRDLPTVEKEDIAQKVAIGALKYSILKQSIGKDIIYDFEKSVSFEGSSGPYLQYSLTRALSVLSKAKSEKVKPSFSNVPKELSDLEKMMHQFPGVVERAGNNLEPHYVVVYLTELASQFNSYYARNKIVDKEDKLSSYRVALTKAFSTIMTNGLWLLAIPSLNRM